MTYYARNRTNDSPRGHGPKREKGMSPWYCACGLPRGEEGSIFRAQGLVPMFLAEKYRAMLRATGDPPRMGHTENGDYCAWVLPGLDVLLRCGAPDEARMAACAVLAPMTQEQKREALISFAAVVKLGGDHALAVIDVFTLPDLPHFRPARQLAEARR